MKEKKTRGIWTKVHLVIKLHGVCTQIVVVANDHVHKKFLIYGFWVVVGNFGVSHLCLESCSFECVQPDVNSSDHVPRHRPIHKIGGTSVSALSSLSCCLMDCLCSELSYLYYQPDYQSIPNEAVADGESLDRFQSGGYILRPNLAALLSSTSLDC